MHNDRRPRRPATGDLAAAVARVRAAGGTSTQPHREPYGAMAECTDEVGFRFALGQFPG